MCGDGRCNGQRCAIDSVAIHQPQTIHGQRAGLVENHGVDFRDALQRATVLDHDAALEQAPGRNDLHHGHGKAERAGAGDDQHRDGDGCRAMQITGHDHPADERQQRRQMHDRRIEPRSAVCDAPVDRAPSLGRFHHPHHFGEE